MNGVSLVKIISLGLESPPLIVNLENGVGMYEARLVHSNSQEIKLPIGYFG